MDVFGHPQAATQMFPNQQCVWGNFNHDLTVFWEHQSAAEPVSIQLASPEISRLAKWSNIVSWQMTASEYLLTLKDAAVVLHCYATFWASESFCPILNRPDAATDPISRSFAQPRALLHLHI